MQDANENWRAGCFRRGSQRPKAHPSRPGAGCGTRQAVDEGRITLKDFQGNLEADEVANLGAAAHAAHEPTAEYLPWELVAQAVRLFLVFVGPKA
eukprot:1575810-Amphidinium_carterae.1